MRASATLFGTLLVVLLLAAPAFALEDGLIETTSSTPNEDTTHVDFERVIANVTEDPIDVAPRDLRMAEYPTMTVVSMTAGSFDDGIWTVGTLAGGQTASITYTGGASTAATQEELPHTGHRDNVTAFAFVGLALVVLGISLLQVTRD